jgi:hypothetical protein
MQKKSLWNTVYGVSQFMSFVDWTRGDHQKAAERQQIFMSTGIWGLVNKKIHRWRGDHEAAAAISQLQKSCLRRTADHIPVVGHVKGIHHLINNDMDEGIHTLLYASKGLFTIPLSIATGGVTDGLGILGEILAPVAYNVIYGAGATAVHTSITGHLHSYGLVRIPFALREQNKREEKIKRVKTILREEIGKEGVYYGVKKAIEKFNPEQTVREDVENLLQVVVFREDPQAVNELATSVATVLVDSGVVTQENLGTFALSLIVESTLN